MAQIVLPVTPNPVSEIGTKRIEPTPQISNFGKDRTKTAFIPIFGIPSNDNF